MPFHSDFINSVETIYGAPVQEVDFQINPEEGRILQYPDNRVHLIDIVYTLRSNFKKLKKSDESIELKFFSFDNLPKLIVPPAIVPLKDISRVLYD